MVQDPNQFNQSVEKGMISNGISPTVIPVKVDPAQVLDLVPGQPVTLSDVAGDGIIVKSLAADTDEVFGIVPYSRGKAAFAAGEYLEVVSEAGVIHLEASAAIARGAKVMPVLAGHKVATATVGKSIAGVCLDKAAADGDLVRVLLHLYGSKAL